MKLRSIVAVALAVTAFLVQAVQGQDAVVRVTEDEARKMVVSKVEPEYPAMAKQMHLAGRAIIDVFIDEEGKVEKVQAVNGNPLLTGAAIAAAKKWKFTPYNAGGQARKAVTSIAFNFKM